MADIVLRDIDPNLLQRIERVASDRGWSLPVALGQLLEIGLAVSEAERHKLLDGREQAVLAQAIAALEQVPNDPGFSLIGRVGNGSEANAQLFD